MPVRRVPPTRVDAILLAGAIVIAPFIALLYRAEAGLVVMAVTLGAVSALLRDALPTVPPERVPWLRLVIGVNIFLTMACLALALGSAFMR